jgi:hypothetical protein
LVVDGKRGISLDGVAELGVEAVDASVDIVLEELTEGRPSAAVEASRNTKLNISVETRV